jgi:hypothetical protein
MLKGLRSTGCSDCCSAIYLNGAHFLNYCCGSLGVEHKIADKSSWGHRFKSDSQLLFFILVIRVPGVEIHAPIEQQVQYSMDQDQNFL